MHEKDGLFPTGSLEELCLLKEGVADEAYRLEDVETLGVDGE